MDGEEEEEGAWTWVEEKGAWDEEEEEGAWAEEEGAGTEEEEEDMLSINLTSLNLFPLH